MRNWIAARIAATFVFALVYLMPMLAMAQQLQDGVTFSGHAVVGGAPPVGTGCTIQGGSTDLWGSCTATAASGTIAFAKAFLTAPHCIVVDQSATPIAVYTETTAQITLTTVTSGHLYRWACVGKPGN